MWTIRTLSHRNQCALDAALFADIAPRFKGNRAGKPRGGPPIGPGEAGFDSYVTRDGGAYELWLSQTSDTSARFSGQLGSSYAFYSVAVDGVGRREAAPLVPDTVTRIEWVAPEAEVLWLGDRLELRWTASPGITYHVERTSALGEDAAWTTIATVPASGSSASWIDTNLATQRFYRLRVDN